MKRIMAVGAVTALAVLGGGGVALADVGTSYKSGTQINFYYHTSGNSRGHDFGGGPNRRICQQAPGATAPQGYESHLKRNRTFQSDETNITLGSALRDPLRCSGYVGTATNANYHTDVSWSNGTPSGPNDNGYENAG